ncbi:polycystin-2-like protein 2 [Ptychodera flava]|uniref:polycystin-2-like protein 2 n=1 Tax=Ptychodera flava TaxID=63121 RepID=UPI00396A8424
MPAGSMRTAWNYYNWFVYILLVICVSLHIYDVITVPQAICIANAVANSTKAKDEIPQTTVHLWQTYIFSATIILIWQRIFKSTRAFTQLGPFINKYYNARIDVMRYIFLYSAFLIPYTCIFWMVFGGLVENYETILETLFSLFRMTLVDDYNYDELREVNPVACDILVGTFLAIAAITIINMFVGALTDSFLSSGEEVESNALMTRAWMILDFEHNLSKSERDRFLTHIHKNRAPLEKRKIYKGNKHLKKKPKTTEDTVEELTKIVDKQKTEISVMKEDMRSLCKMYDGVLNIMTEKRKASAETEP